MSGIRVRTIHGPEVVLDAGQVTDYGSSLRGTLISPGQPDYDAARTVWNGMIDRHPALIARCRGAADVRASIAFARTHGLLISIKSGGHHIAGNAVADGGLLIDLSQLKSVRINPTDLTAWVEAGVTLGEFDREAQAFGLATPLGINSTTGVAGLTLGGGFGWISRRFGLTCDNLRAADIVTVDGALRRVDANHDPDLFWAIRGGGGNFGVVTAFEFDLHAVGPTVLAGLIVHPFDDASSVMGFYRDFVATTPEELTVWMVLRKAPPLPFLPEKWHGREVVVVVAVWVGDQAEGERVLKPLRAFGQPLADVIGPTPFAGFQTAFDPLLTPGARNYWKSHDLARLGDGALDVLQDFVSRLPSPQTEVFVGQLGKAVARVPADATAFGRRDAEFVVNVHGRWESAADDQRCIAWCRSFFDTLAPHALGTTYVNFMTEDEGGRVQAAYGPNYERLVALKQRYDPDNLLRMNMNLAPAHA
jgi:FAD/FMN-containing dehydrogenase